MNANLKCVQMDGNGMTRTKWLQLYLQLVTVWVELISDWDNTQCISGPAKTLKLHALQGLILFAKWI